MELLNYRESIKSYLELIGEEEICIMVHNSHFYLFPCNKINEENDIYEDPNITYCGSSTSYLEMTSFLKYKEKFQYDPYDLLMLYQSGKYDEDNNKKEKNKLNEIATNISDKYKKLVSIGYTYIIPEEQREIFDNEVFIQSIYEGQIIYENAIRFKGVTRNIPELEALLKHHKEKTRSLKK